MGRVSVMMRRRDQTRVSETTRWEVKKVHITSWAMRWDH